MTGVRWHTLPINPAPRRRPSMGELIARWYGDDPTYRFGLFGPPARIGRPPCNAEAA